MKSLAKQDKPALSLRERKKIRTFTTIQQQALRMFQEQGYDATTVEQIAAAAEVSPSTFFRYFRTKEDVVIRDLYDSMIVETFRAQPADLSPIQAARRGIKAVFADLPDEEMASLQIRVELARSVPELRAAMLDELTRSLLLFAGVLAERLGCSPNDIRVRTFSGVLMGVSLAALVAMLEDPSTDVIAQFDAGLGFIEDGLKF